MPSLNQVLAALRREIDAALGENPAPTSGIRLDPDRVVFSLEFSVLEQPASDGSVALSFDVVTAGASREKPKTHTLTFEFKTVPDSSSLGATKPAPAQRKPHSPKKKQPHLDPAEEDEVVQSLSSVFGAPGLDSSARAEVFRGAFAELSEQQAALLIGSFSSGTVPENDERLRNAHHRLNGVFRSGPLRSTEQGSEIIAELLSRHALEPVLLLMKDKWKSQADWLGP